MSGVEIRPTVPADLDLLAEVLMRVHEIDGYPVEGVNNPRAWIDIEAIGQWTAVKSGVPVGHVAIVRPSPSDAAPGMLAEQEGTRCADIAVLTRLFLAPVNRGHSLADSLVEVAERQARLLKLRLTLDVMEKDARAISLYQRRGWVTLGTFDHIHGSDERTPAIAMVAPS